MSDELDFEDQMHSRRNAFFGRMKKCNRCGMFNTDEGVCPICKKGKMMPV
jgi:rubrerythrin